MTCKRFWDQKAAKKQTLSQISEQRLPKVHFFESFLIHSSGELKAVMENRKSIFAWETCPSMPLAFQPLIVQMSEITLCGGSRTWTGPSLQIIRNNQDQDYIRLYTSHYGCLQFHPTALPVLIRLGFRNHLVSPCPVATHRFQLEFGR